jgi:hypothetical protein
MKGAPRVKDQLDESDARLAAVNLLQRGLDQDAASINARYKEAAESLTSMWASAKR